LQKLFLSLILPAFLLAGCTGSFTDEITPYGLKCEHTNSPIGIEAPNFRLSWMLQSEARGQKQSAYQVLVESSLDKLYKNEGDIWNNRKIKSENSVHIPYQGKPLEPGADITGKPKHAEKDFKERKSSTI
jgi:alpha-L-rhamnosidase